MLTRFVTLVTLACFVNALLGCYGENTIVRTDIPEERPLRIVAVVMEDGTRYVFNEVGGVLRHDTVWGVLPGESKPRKIPLSQIRTLTVEQVDAGKTILAVVLVGGAVIGLLALASSSSGSKSASGQGSCPFVYSSDGSVYVLDGEPLGGAFCEGLRRTDLCQLEHARPVHDQYHILLRNELDETQYVDEFKLQLVEHRPGVQVVPDAGGRVFAIANPVPPSRVVDQQGRNLTRFLSASDDYLWETDLRSKDPARKEDLRDTLFLTFPRPRDASSVNLVVNGGTALWGSRVIARMTEIRGELIPEWYEALKSPEAMGQIDFWDNREEVLRLQIRIRVGDRWETRGVVRGNGPYLTEERCIPLSLQEVDGDSLEIQITPPAGYWQLNRFAVDYGGEEPPGLQEISADSIVGADGSDLRDLLQSTDGRYYVMPVTGQEARLVFRVPPPQPGMERTVFARVSGYYDMHLEAAGEPQDKEIRLIESEPGYPAAFALKEFQAWKAQMSAVRGHIPEEVR